LTYRKHMKAKYLLTFFLLLLCALISFAQVPAKNEVAPTLVELLQNGESYSIEITSIGCFNGSRQTLTVSKDADIISAHLKENTKELTGADIQKFIDFEHQLRALKMGGCTTVDTYVLSYQGETFRTSDGTCSWHGYRKIINIFG